MGTVTDTWADDGDHLKVSGTGESIAGYTSSSSTNSGAIVVGNDGATIYNGFVFDSSRADKDRDGVLDVVELVAIAVYYLSTGGCDADRDGDESSSAECGGDDCDDTDASNYPGAEEVPDNGIDDDCDNDLDETTSDADDDSYAVADGDCDDGDVTAGVDLLWSSEVTDLGVWCGNTSTLYDCALTPLSGAATCSSTCLSGRPGGCPTP